MKPSTTLSRTNLLAILFCFASLATAQMQAQPADYDAVTEAHGVTGSLAFVIIWPLGAILIRLLSFKGSVWIHAATQALGLLLFIVNFGTGVWQAIVSDQINTYHPIIGIILFGLALFQPLLGLAHHLRYQKIERRTVVTYMHIWLGRLLITLGMINGGLGLLLSANASTGEYIAYGVIAAVIWVAYVALVVGGEVAGGKGKGGEKDEKERRDY